MKIFIEWFEMSDSATIKPIKSKATPTFSLATLFALVTVFSLWMGLAVTLPVVAVPVLMLLVPTIVRGFAEIMDSGKEGHKMTFAQKAERFSYSFLVVTLVYAITFGAIFCFLAATLIVIGPLGYLFDLRGPSRLVLYGVSIASIPASVIIASWLYWRWWPRRGKRPW